MQVYVQPRGGGKTTAAIVEAEQTNGYIVCYSPRECERVFAFAEKLGKKIRMPITWKEFLESRGAWPDLKYHIDNLDLCVQSMTGKEIVSAYLTEPDL